MSDEKEICMNPNSESNRCEDCPYTGQCALEDPVEPKYAFGNYWCGKCRLVLVNGGNFCPECGQAVKWE